MTSFNFSRVRLLSNDDSLENPVQPRLERPPAAARDRAGAGEHRFRQPQDHHVETYACAPVARQ
jgi:hypothetical protein